jgi:asparagine synthase (glutamine-hydrolysing)
MCGIWLVLGGLARQQNVIQYLHALEKRGPDNTKTIKVNSNLILGFTRLAINGIGSAGDQPMCYDETRTICNGEIYNYKELAKRHSIELPSGVSDCFVLPRLYKKFISNPTTFCRALDGVYALIICNVERNEIFIARDPYGVRPLFQAKYEDESIAWSSEIKGFPPGYTSISHFPPGSFARYILSGNALEIRKYHEIPYQQILSEKDIATQLLKTTLTSAVKKRLLSDRPIGALLSGGLDSSLVAAILARELNGMGKKLHTFSIGMSGSTDLEHARQVANHIDSIHHEIIVNPNDFIDAIPEVIRAIESYDVTTVRASVGNYLIGKWIRENTDIKVVFNGDGSDEIGGGYIYFYAAPNDEEFEEDSERLLNEIHMFDVLRSDRCISSHGLEPRTPFLDKSFVAVWRSISTKYRRPTNAPRQVEKYILRHAFQDDNLLPENVLWRKKEAFSDGVSSVNDSWYKRCQTLAIDEKSRRIFLHNPPKTSEAYYYRTLFEEYYGSTASTLIPHMWMPRWINATDPSARTLTTLY